MADNVLGKAGAEPVNIQIQVGDSIRMSDEDLIRLRSSSEDHFVERKSFGLGKRTQ
jgi:hypothetical protein